MRLAAIDVGTNSIHMIIVDTRGDRGFEVVDRAKTMVKLGAGLFRRRHMTDRAFQAGLDTLRMYCKLAESRGVQEILAVATSATREADNGGAFMEAVFHATGLSPRVISGTAEGHLIYRAVRHALDLADERVLVLDIGGGSVEAVVGEGHEVVYGDSLRLGVQRLLDGREKSDPLSAKHLHVLRGYIQGAAHDVVAKARDLRVRRVIGTSGTIRTLGEAVLLASGVGPLRSVNAQVVKRKALKELSKKLLSLPRDERARVPGIPEERADTIHLGAVLLVELLELAGIEELTLCDASLREGILLDYLDHRGPATAPVAPVTDVRRRSVLELASKFGCDDPGDRHVAALALQLFDQTTQLHGCGVLERELLEWAALLRGVGQHIGFPSHNKHAGYVIRNARLRGFAQEEIELIAETARYHRKAPPSKAHKRFRKLSRRERHIVRMLSGILRVAVGLDRGHTQQVKRVSASVYGGELRLVVGGAADLALELYAARERTAPLAHALGMPITVVKRAASHAPT